MIDVWFGVLFYCLKKLGSKKGNMINCLKCVPSHTLVGNKIFILRAVWDLFKYSAIMFLLSAINIYYDSIKLNRKQ